MSTRFVNTNGIELLQFDLLQSDNLFHFTTTIKGGISRDTYASFNLGMYCGDNIESVALNREILAESLGIEEENIFIPYQTHDDKVLVIDKSFLDQPDLEKVKLMNGVDALITNQINICIGITTADCVPILVFDPHKKILAAIHAGWKGTVAKIVAKTVTKMIEQFSCHPQHLLVGIAPCILQEQFEVGNEVLEQFTQASFRENEIAYINRQTGKPHINLQEANKLVLAETGVPLQNIQIAEICTYSTPDKFFSARRQTIHSGRMVTGGVLR